MDEKLKEQVKERYAGVARSVSAGSRGLDSEAPEVDWTGGGLFRDREARAAAGSS